MEQQSTERRVVKARISPQIGDECDSSYSFEIGPILIEQLEYLIDHAEEEGDRYERVAAILMERFQ